MLRSTVEGRIQSIIMSEATMARPFRRLVPLIAGAVAFFATPALAQIPVAVPASDCEASEDILVPINVGNLTGEGVYAFAFTVRYDSELISIGGVSKSSTLSSNYNVIANPKESEIRVSAASATPLSGQGTLVNLTVSCLAQGSAPVTFDSFRFNEGSPAASTENGVVLVGMDVQINLDVNTEDVHFGTITIGAAQTQIITVTNLATSNAELVGSIALQNNDASSFRIESGGGAFSLAAGASHEVTVAFDPDAPGTYGATLQVSHNATSSTGPATISLSGRALAATPSVDIEVGEIDLGEVILQRNVTSSLTIDNNGIGTITGALEITGADAASFFLASPAEFSIESGESVEIGVGFAPLTAGLKSAELHITHDAQNVSSPIIIQLHGEALLNVSTELDHEVPGSYLLDQNYPNPFNPNTTISFGLPATGPVRVSIYDLTGRERSVVVDGVLSAGWHLVDFDAGTLPSGTYLYQLQAEHQTVTRKMTLLK